MLIYWRVNHLKSALFWSYSFHFCHLCPAGSLDSYFSERYGEERKSQLQQLFPPKTTGTWWISKYFQAAQACETDFSHLVMSTCHICAPQIWHTFYCLMLNNVKYLWPRWDVIYLYLYFISILIYIIRHTYIYTCNILIISLCLYL